MIRGVIHFIFRRASTTKTGDGYCEEMWTMIAVLAETRLWLINQSSSLLRGFAGVHTAEQIISTLQE